MRKSDRIREIAPGLSWDDAAIVDEALARVNGAVDVASSQDNRTLGRTYYKGSITAHVVVESTHLSRQSGGTLYRLTEVHTPDCDHFVISSLPKIVREPVEG